MNLLQRLRCDWFVRMARIFARSRQAPFTLAGDRLACHHKAMVGQAQITLMLPLAALALVTGGASMASASPLALYDTTQDPAPLAPLAPAAPCGGLAVACSASPVSPHKVLPFDYGLAVSGSVVGSSRGAFSGVGVSGWVKPKDLPLSVYFDVEHFQPIGRIR